jgi:hypothetical protein
MDNAEIALLFDSGIVQSPNLQHPGRSRGGNIDRPNLTARVCQPNVSNRLWDNLFEIFCEVGAAFIAPWVLIEHMIRLSL